MPSGVYDRTNWNPWNKGIPRTAAEKKKISEGHKGLVDGNRNPNWRGGTYTDGEGYVFIFSPNHIMRDVRNYVKRSHLVLEEFLCRPVFWGESVHHINGIKNDDRIENLQLCENESVHVKLHNKNRLRDKKGQFVSTDAN